MQMIHKQPVLALDVGGTKIAGGLVLDDGQVNLEQQIPTQAQAGGEAVLNRTIGLLKSLRQEAGTMGFVPAAVGVAAAGDVDPKTGVIVFATDAIPGWKGMAVRQEIETALDLPVFVDNDANAMALGEAVFGAGRGHQHVIGLTAGTGIGGGIVIDGKVYHGALGFAGGFGHLIVDYSEQQRCQCGHYGCLEAFASSPPIVADFLDRVGEQRLPQDLGLTSENMDVKAIAALAHKGHPEAVAAIQRGAYFMGVGIATLLNVLNPDVVVIGGGIAQIGERYFTTIRQTVLERALPLLAQTPVLPAKLGTQANLIGAACLVWGTDLEAI